MHSGAYGGGEWRCVGEASNNRQRLNNWPSPILWTPHQFALLRLHLVLIIGIPIKMFGDIFCGFDHVHNYQTEGLSWKPVETRRNSEEVATCPLCVNRREGNVATIFPFCLHGCRLGRHANMENIEFDWLDGNWASNIEFSTSDSPRAGTAAEPASQAAERVD